MQVIKFDLPDDVDSLEIHTLADLHIGDNFCDIELVRNTIDYISDTENAYVILNGDLMNNATKTSVSDSYAEKLSPMEQISTLVDLLTPIKHKIIWHLRFILRPFMQEEYNNIRLKALELMYSPVPDRLPSFPFTC